MTQEERERIKQEAIKSRIKLGALQIIKSKTLKLVFSVHLN